MTDGHRIVTNASDWMRSMERRITGLERRRGVSNIEQHLGNGISPYARLLIDWNDPTALQNGWYYTDTPALNSPDPLYGWIGEVITTPMGHGIMRIFPHSSTLTLPTPFWRQFHNHPTEPTELTAYGSWIAA